MKVLISHLLSSLLFLLLAIGVNAQNASKIGFELREYLKVVNASDQVPLLVEGNSLHMEEIVQNYGGRVRLKVNNLFSLEIPAQYVLDFSMEEAVYLIEFSMAKGQTLSDTMLIQTNVDSIMNKSAPLRADYTGKGVAIGIIDSGIELAHPDFQDSTGKTRIMYVWDQGVAYDPNRQAASYSYGVEWDSTDINAGISTHDDNPIEFGHGSNVTGVAASNGLASGNLKGVAPEANLIVVATDFRKPNWLQTVAEAVDYIYRKADSMGLPCVINASVGTYLGSHDGKDVAARMINNLITQKNGRAMVCAAGNAGTLSFHARHDIVNDTAFTWFEYAPAQWAGLGGYYFEVWSDTNDFSQLQFSIGADKELSGQFSFRGRTAFDSIQNRLNVIYNDSIISLSGNKLADIETFATQSQGRYKLEVAIVDPDSANYLYRLETKGTGKIDVWGLYSLIRHNDMRKNNLPSIAQFPDIRNYAAPDSLQSIVSSFSSSPTVITVGNYVNQSNYIDVSGTVRNINVTPGQISINSSRGPNRNDSLKPEIASAGDYMFAAGRLATIASAIASNPAKVSQDSMHFRNGGTSMASPTVAGMVALYLQQCPNATNQQIRNDLFATAKADQYTGSLPNIRWGNGKADGFQFMKRQVFAPTIQTILPNLCDGDSLGIALSSNFNLVRWNTGDTSNLLTIYQTGDYYAWAENQTGCLSPSDTITTLFHPLPQKPTINQNGYTLSLAVTGNFLWYYNQIPLFNQRNSSILAINSGDYYCIYTDNNGCSISTDTVNIVVTSLDQFESSNTLSISPNPSKGKFVIQHNREEPIQSIAVHTMEGRLVWSEKLIEKRQRLEMDLSHLNNGIYLLSVSGDKFQHRSKLLIQ